MWVFVKIRISKYGQTIQVPVQVSEIGRYRSASVQSSFFLNIKRWIDGSVFMDRQRYIHTRIWPYNLYYIFKIKYFVIYKEYTGDGYTGSKGVTQATRYLSEYKESRE